MKAVLDASVGLKALIPEQGSDKALNLLSEFRRGVHELLAPDLYMIEIGNILVQMSRASKLPPGDLQFHFGELMSNLPIFYPSASLFPEAFLIATRTRVSVYDALYLALSARETCPLITADEKLIKAAPGFSFLTLDDL